MTKKKKKAKQTYWLHWALICRSGLNCPDGRIELNIRRKTLMLLDNIAWMVLKCDYVNRRTPLSQSALPLLSSSLIQPDIWQLADTSSQETEPDIWFEQSPRNCLTLMPMTNLFAFSISWIMWECLLKTVGTLDGLSGSEWRESRVLFFLTGV